MASGDSLLTFHPYSNEPSASLASATLDLRNSHPVLDFDDTTAEYAVFGGVLPRNYAGGGITIAIVWMATSATTGDVVWLADWERHQDDVTDLDSDGFTGSPQSVTATAPSASGETSYDEIVFTDGAQIDSLAVGESFRLRINRAAANPSDDMVGDAELLRIEVRET